MPAQPAVLLAGFGTQRREVAAVGAEGSPAADLLTPDNFLKVRRQFRIGALGRGERRT